MTDSDGAPEGLLDAFWAYERALMDNDLPTLDRLFAPGPQTVRGDANGLLVGHDAISEYRRGRGGAPRRRVLSVQVHIVDDDSALVIAVTQPTSGGRGQQTQLWARGPAGWVVRAAHVSLPAPAIATSTWRVVGSPLVAGGAGGPLSGHTVAVKDLFALAGHAIGAGVPQYLASAPIEAATAPAVQALLDAGASVQGIAQTDEFAYSIAGKNPHYGTPPNPAVTGGIPGGSSSGPASAVATGQASIGLGTDTGGSIRVPASYNGLWGLRTTHGSVDTTGLLPLAPSFDTVGWLTRDAESLRAVAQVMLRDQRPVEPRYAVAPLIAEPEVADAMVELTETIGADVVELGDIDHLYETFRIVQSAEAWHSYGDWVTAHPGALGSAVAGRFEFAATITPDQEARARDDLAAARASIEAILRDRILLVPSASSVAPSATADGAHIERIRAATLRITSIAGITGRPGLSVPLFAVERPWAAVDLPVGLCLVGPRGTDLALIDLGERLVEDYG
jgi:Asp-tRNA(Asn)/Glu-tRNA(Gln) amidotransferase A subunit family amidase